MLVKLRIGHDRLLLFSFFIGLIVIGSFFLALPVAWRDSGSIAYIDALFTATSAVCVTGLITVDTTRFSHFGHWVIMLLIQGGGLGIISFATLYLALPRKKISVVSRGMINEYSVSEVEYQPKKIIRSIIGFTFFIEAIGTLVLHIRFGARGGSLFVSAFHAVSAFCNAGFSTFSDNLERYTLDPLVNLTIMALIISGGLGFIVLRDIGLYLRHKRMHVSYHSMVVLRTTAALIVAGSAAFFVLESRGVLADFNPAQKVLASMFQAVTPRTAGFDTIAQDRFGTGSHLLTILLMFIGASPASTGGGVKTTTFFILMMTAFRYREKTDYINYLGRTLSGHSIYRAVGIVVKSLVIIFVVSIAIAMLEERRGNHCELIQVLFETVSALGTAGLSLGITGSLGLVSKLLIILTMFIGRVGLFAVALPETRRRIEGFAALPGVEIMLG